MPRGARSALGAARGPPRAARGHGRRQCQYVRAGHQQGLRQPLGSRDGPARSVPQPFGHQSRPLSWQALDARRTPFDRQVVPAGKLARDAAAAGRGGHHRAVELPALPRGGAAHWGADRGQPRDAQALRVHAGVRRAVRGTLRQGIPGGGDRRGQWRCVRGGGVLEAAVRSPAVHRLDFGGEARHARRGRQPHAGDPRARREIACHRGARLFDRACGAAHPARQVLKRGADLHCAGLCARPPGQRGGLHRGRARLRCEDVPGHPEDARLLEHRLESPLRAHHRLSPRGPDAGRSGGEPVCEGRGARSRVPPHPADRAHRREARHARHAGGDLRPAAADRALHEHRRGDRLRERSAPAARALPLR